MERASVWLLTIVLALFGAALLLGGVPLAFAGGSIYYCVAGAAVLLAGIQLARRRSSSVFIFAAVLVGTLLWSLSEVGLDGWPLAPRLIAFAVLGLLFLLPAVRSAAGGLSRWWIGAPVLGIALVIVAAGVRVEFPAQDLTSASAIKHTEGGGDDWRNYGRSPGGGRYSPLTEIDTSNVRQLELAWQFKSNVPAFGSHTFEATPLAVDDRLFVCLDLNVIVALDQDSGRELWRFDPHTELKGIYGATCRGVSYFEAPQPVAECQQRILFGTADNRLIALDAHSGHLCSSFGVGGIADLRAGMGDLSPGDTLITSPPAIVNGVAVVGQFVSDYLSLDAPSGVVRGYDAITGSLRWAWDIGRPDRVTQPPEGEHYTRNTPNAWTVLSGDEALGLVYVPTGNSTPDYFGARRTSESEKYSSSVVAIEAATGKVRWSFQTVHHDLWDYDVASQPVAVDLPDSQGTIPALIVPTKRGELFVLDRRDGHPIDNVVEKPVPQGGGPGDWLAKTQPFTTGFPSVAGADLREADMWGLTPLDQLWCRVQFRRSRYEGVFTPPSMRPTIAYPGAAGGSNWGSVTVDSDRGLLVLNTLHIADVGHMIPREVASGINMSHFDRTMLFPQQGIANEFKRSAFMSPIGVPCQQPPYGRISAFDIRTRQLVWSESLGTAARSGPWGLQSLLPIRIGVPNMGGSMATAGGLIFIAATQDRFLRALDIGNGHELWRFSLPAVGVATPMTYRSRRSSRQFVVIAAGGHPGIPGPSGSALMAFALPTHH